MDRVGFPTTLYHGTLDLYLESFTERLLNRTFWRPGRDFGEGFYTTISMQQAMKWAVQGAKHYAGLRTPVPCVLKIQLLPKKIDVLPRIFMSPEDEWIEFVFRHRVNDRKGWDPCRRHPDLLIGPMADNDTGAIVRDAVKLGKDAAWFGDKITRDRRGRRLDPLKLGNQVVFAHERLEDSLKLVGYYLRTEGRWKYHDNQSVRRA
ncbi:DUF3990 domain-containing protein [Paenibacillus sp.]|uniref:DUF3990 domain-containing protein n=1 Tax=Paenibacillus sp. TaxID=58172 RepID=UPI002D4F4BB8|nr:DUF3990 domain-containing protein [Paenibacillus sp.]HZG55031.1 DUF3990 domain-containing protein [Paenibacillus sp.]